MTQDGRIQPPPADDYLQWVLNNPQQVADYLRTVYALRQLEVVVVQGGTTRRYPVKFSDGNAIVQIFVD